VIAMILSHQTEQNIDIIAISGRLIMTDAAEVRERIKSVIDRGQGALLLDLGELAFIDSSGCSVLISAFKAMRARNGRLVLCALSPEVQSLIELTRLNEIFEIFPDTETAMSALRKG
jgi:anti-sigma B factor antagonist